MSKLQRLRDNIAAIEHALSGGTDPDVLAKYSGFGGMNFILNDTGDKSAWSKSDQVYYDDTVRLRQMLVKAAGNGNKYDAWLQSLKSSTLTAFYTPVDFAFEIVETIFSVSEPVTILDPAAGALGQFVQVANAKALSHSGKSKCVAYEKDIISGLILKGYSSLNRIPVTDVRIDGFETIPDSELGTFDLVATNVPFGNISVFDPAYTRSKSEVRRDAAKMIHRYYVLKGLDCLKDGGIEAYIITSNYLNNDGMQLAEALKQARLIGAYRLANNLFKDAGTEVGTDLLVLQKDSRKQGITADESLLLTQYEDNGCPTNMYFTIYPDHVIATDTERGTDPYGKPGFVYSHSGGVAGIAKDMAKVLSQDLGKVQGEAAARNNGTTELRSNGMTESRSNGTTELRSNGKAKATRKSDKERALLDLQTVYNRLYNNEAESLTEDSVNRMALNAYYDEFVKEYGYLNDRENREMVERVGKELLSLEVKNDNCQLSTVSSQFVKADIFFKPVAFSTEERKAGTPQEALAWSLNQWGRVEMTEMSCKTCMTEEALVEALRGEVFWNPLNNEWEIKAKFISGDVISKAAAIERLGGETAEHKTALAALRDAVPTPIPFDDLDFNLGERWMDPAIYGRFATEFFTVPPKADRPAWVHDEPLEIEVKYDPTLDQFAASKNCGYNAKISEEFCVSSEASSRYDGIDLLVHALQNSCPKLMKYMRDANGRRRMNDKGDWLKEEDPEKMQVAMTKIEEIRAGYQDWLQRQPKEFRDDLADQYNKRFNCFVKPQYDGSHQTFPGLDYAALRKNIKGFKDLYQTQKDCIWMLLLNGGGIVDHEVGGGKTLIMCVAAHEMKRLGMCHKPMIIGLKANVGEIAKTYKMAYPQAKVLYASEKDYCAKERVQFFNSMKNNDWDCIIMSHDQFGRIPQSDDIQLEILQDELQQVEDALEVAKAWGYRLSSKVLRGLETRKRNTEAKIKNLQFVIKLRKDDVVDFRMMGIDHIFVDESHQFKNLGFSTRHDRVAGIGNTKGSQRAYNLLMAIRTIQKRTGKDLGATFLSGTTVTNSLTELYSLFRYLRPKALKRQGITCFDAWAAIFTKKSQEYEFSITNQIVLKERFRYFIKVPELAMFYNEITDFRTAEDVGLERPQKNTMLYNIQPTPDQEAFIKTLMKFAQTGDFKLIGIDEVDDKQKKAKMLYATDMARKMSLDMRMIDPIYPDHPRSKASCCAIQVKQYYDLYDEQKGVQLIFSDLSTYQGKDKGWNVYEEIKHKLVMMGIPEKEIRFIQECKCERKKQALIEQVNRGEVRVLFGSTTMLGTGVNAQQRVVAVHHLDTPWRPSDLEQRDGRAIRKGNEVARDYAGNKVDIIIYAVERSLDPYKFNLLHCKQTFIYQLKRGQLSIRTIDEGAMDEDGGMNFSEFMAVLSGNTDLLERAKLEKKIAGLEAERKNFNRELRDRETLQASLTEENETKQRHIEDAKADLRKFEQSGGENDITLSDFSVPDGLSDEERDKAIGEALFKIADTARTSGACIEIGTVCGFPIVVKTIETGRLDEEIKYQNLFYVKGERLNYSYNEARLNRTSARLSATYPLLALRRIPDIIKGWEMKIAANNARIEQLAQLTRTWAKEEQLRKMKADLALLDRKINEDLKKTENPALPKAA